MALAFPLDGNESIGQGSATDRWFVLRRDDTIFALSSGVGRAAIAIVRISGPSVRRVLERLCGRVPKPRYAWLRALKRPDGALLDQAVVLFFPGPHSETGEDICELQLHGGRAVVAAVLAEIGRMEGLRAAEPGEFARRALINGKMDLVGAEALADLIDADTELQRLQAVDGGGMHLGRHVGVWRDLILDIRSDLEASIDFSDEGDVSDRLDSQVERNLARLIAEFDQHLAQTRRAERVREGYSVVLCGRPNAGKSSLLNWIVGRDVAIVSHHPGTTRDRIEVLLDLGGVPVRLIDTAGIHDTMDEIELEGIARTRSAAEQADLVLWLSPRDAPSPIDAAISARNFRVIETKADLPVPRIPGISYSVSARDGVGLDALMDAIEAEARDCIAGPAVLLTRERHRSAIIIARSALIAALDNRHAAEVCAFELRQAELALDQLVGRIGVEDVLGSIFSRFCVGK